MSLADQYVREVHSAFNLKTERFRSGVGDWNRRVPSYALPRK